MLDSRQIFELVDTTGMSGPLRHFHTNPAAADCRQLHKYLQLTTVYEKAMPVNFVNRLFPEEFFVFLYKISPIFFAHTVNHIRNAWSPADF
jgi:hypothetical protein